MVKICCFQWLLDNTCLPSGGISNCYRFLFVVMSNDVDQDGESETDARCGSAEGGQGDVRTGALKSFI